MNELEREATRLLEADVRAELCRECNGRGEVYDCTVLPVLKGNKTPTGVNVIFQLYKCANNHQWASGEGKMRGIGGESPILFEEHLRERARREIFTESGIPEPEKVAGLYNRTHPNGSTDAASGRRRNK